MNSPLTGPRDRYRLVVEALHSRDGTHFTRSVAEAGIPLGGGARPAQGEAPGAPPSSYLVVVDEACSLILRPGENGVSVQEIRLLDACQLRLTASVTPGSCAPDWLEGEGSYLLFDGDSLAAAATSPRYIPFNGMAAPDEWPAADSAPLDLLAVAVGRSVERANATLACCPSLVSTALVSSVTIRVGLSRVDLGRNRVLLGLARPDEGGGDQFVELTLTTNFTALPEPAAEGGGAAATGAQAGAQGGGTAGEAGGAAGTAGNAGSGATA